MYPEDFEDYFVEPDFTGIPDRRLQPLPLLCPIISLDTIMRSSENFVIIGPPGSGKTTTLKYIGYKLEKRQERIKTRYIRINFPLSSEANFEELFSWVKERKGENLLFLIDDFDAVSQSSKVSFASNLSLFSSKYPKTKFILCTRRISPEEIEALEGFIPVEIQKFSSTQVGEYLSKKGLQNWQEFKNCINGSRVLSELAKNPLMLNIIIQYYDVIVSEDYLVDPTIYIKNALEKSLSRIEFSLNLEADFVNNYLKNLASFLHSEAKMIFTKKEFINIFRFNGFDACPNKINIESIIKELMNAFVITNEDIDKYSFSHVLIYEHFLTLYLRKISGAEGAKIIIHKNNHILTAIKIRDNHSYDKIIYLLNGVRESISLSKSEFTPLYAEDGSIKLFIAITVAAGLFHTFATFSNGFFTKAGNLAAEKMLMKDESILIPEEILLTLPSWLRNNNVALEIFKKELVTAYAQRKSTQIDTKEIISIAIDTVWEEKFHKSIEKIPFNIFTDIKDNKANR